MKQLNTRQARLLLYLLNHEGFHTSQALGQGFEVTSRTIRSDVDRIAAFINELELDADITRKPSEGIQLQASIKTAQMIKMALRPYPDTQDQTLKDILFEFASRTTYTHVQDVMDRYYVSRSKALQLLDELEMWLGRYGLELKRRRQKGFRLSGEEWKMRQMMKDVFMEEQKSHHWDYDVQLVWQEFKQLEQELHFPLTDRARNNLLYHTLIFIQRLRLGNVMQEQERTTDDLLYQHPEYETACRFVRRLSGLLQVRIPPHEADYFALHLLGSKRERVTDHAADELSSWNLFDSKAAAMMETFIEAVASDYSQDMASDEDFKRALLLHFQTTLHRMRYRLRMENPMLQEIKKEYESSFDWVKYWVQNVQEPLLKDVPEDEIGFLMIHLQSAIERHRQITEPIRNVLIVCESGMGTAYLIKEKFNNLFPGVRHTEVSAVHEWKHKNDRLQPDLILSTVAIDDERVFQVSPVFSREDQKALTDWMNTKDNTRSVLVKYSSASLFFPGMQADSRTDAVEQLADALINQGYALPALKEHALKRETLGSTAISAQIAIPHGHREDSMHSAIAAALLQEPVDWGGQSVSIVFFIAVDYESPGEAEALFKELFHVSGIKERTDRLKKAQTYQEFITILRESEEIS
ncbi:BglG family transcription antiterminator [Salibacterium halotolerans]|uniref:Transcriptional antiterminator n=1 Tax=Salibacterium halotolerans TaxID=1884432 RepID=A0A1I5X1X7_9BACI|nr:BglG family transcription antiterminator [Salibacterium halotolerans]SFQ25938.1 Transcriptional antiterminator [Salibacterium halotolerans]